MYESALFALLYVAGMFLVAACQWLCIVKLAGTERKSIWLMMVAGSTLLTVSMPGLAWYLYRVHHDPILGLEPAWTIWFEAANAAYLLGELLFVTGFMLHCMTLSKSSERVRELENIIAAQAQENARLREAGR